MKTETIVLQQEVHNLTFPDGKWFDVEVFSRYHFDAAFVTLDKHRETYPNMKFRLIDRVTEESPIG